MVALVIFWASVFAVLFFVCGTFFKALAAAFDALLSSAAAVIGIGFLAGVAVILLGIVYEITDELLTKGMGAVLGMIFLFIITIGILWLLFGGFGSLLLGMALIVVEGVLTITSIVLEGMASFFEKGYAKFLAVIIKQIDKC